MTFIKLCVFETLWKILIISLISNIKIEILAVLDLPNNFLLIMEGDFHRSKWLNYLWSYKMEKRKFRKLIPLRETRITQQSLIVPSWNWDPSSSESVKQLSLNNGRRFPLTKVVKLCTEVTKRKKQKFRKLVPLRETRISQQPLIVPSWKLRS